MPAPNLTTMPAPNRPRGNAFLELHFVKIHRDNINTIDRARCRYCPYIRAWNATRLAEHLTRCGPFLRQNEQRTTLDQFITNPSTEAAASSFTSSREFLHFKAALAIHAGGNPFTIFEEPWLKDFLKSLNSTYEPPSTWLLSNRLLDDVYSHFKKQEVHHLHNTPFFNVIFDGTDDKGGNRVFNVSVSLPQGVAFYWKTFDTGFQIHDAETTVQLIKPILQELVTIDSVPEWKRINGIATDTNNTMRNTQRLIQQSPQLQHTFTCLCDSHGLQLLIKDIVEGGQRVPGPWKQQMRDAQELITIFRTSKLQLSRLRAEQMARYGKHRALLTSCVNFPLT